MLAALKKIKDKTFGIIFPIQVMLAALNKLGSVGPSNSTNIRNGSCAKSVISCTLEFLFFGYQRKRSRIERDVYFAWAQSKEVNVDMRTDAWSCSCKLIIKIFHSK